MAEDTEVRKSSEGMQHENIELSRLNRQLIQENNGMRAVLRELTNVFAFVVQMNCGGKLTLSSETLKMIQTSQNFNLDISEDDKHNRTYLTRDPKKSEQIAAAQGRIKLATPRNRR